MLNFLGFGGMAMLNTRKLVGMVGIVCVALSFEVVLALRISRNLTGMFG